ncbi:MAG: hypothetical protein RR231_13030 [Acinetobacter sp.]
MSSRLQVGGLALVVNSKFEENIGKVVRLVEYLDSRKSPFDNETRDYWRVEHSEPAIGRNVFGFESKSLFTNIPPQNLMPLGDQQTQDELRKEQEGLTCKN